jgi:IS66 C-terminal element
LGGRRPAAIYTLIKTCLLNDIDAKAWLADVLARIADHPAKQITDLLPWNWKPTDGAAMEPRAVRSEALAGVRQRVIGQPSRRLSERPLAQVNVPRLADQAIDENEAADGPADRLDGEIAVSVIVIHQGQVGRGARLPRQPQAGLHQRVLESLLEPHEAGDTVTIACQDHRSLPMTSREARDAIELDLEGRHRKSAGCPHCGIDDGRWI